MNTATMISDREALNITIKLLANPLLIDSVKAAVNIGPGIEAPINPKTNMLMS